MTTVNGTLLGNDTIPEGELFLWHGAELLVIPLIMVLGIMGNIIVFYVYHFRWRSTSVTLFKRILAVLDLCNVTVALPPLLYVTVCPTSPSFLAACSLTSFVALGTGLASVGVLVVIAVDRFMKLCLLRIVGIELPMIKKIFAVIVLISILLTIPTGWIFGRDNVYHSDYNVQVSSCFIDSRKKDSAFFLVYSVLLGIVFIGITTVLVILYYKIIKQLCELSKKHEELMRRPSWGTNVEVINRQRQSQVMRQSAMVFIAITVVFFVSYAPYLASLFVSMADKSVQGGMGPGLKALFDLAKLCPLLNNVANPFIYSFTSSHFRKDVKKMITLKMCEKEGFFTREYPIGSASAEMTQFSECLRHRE